MNNKGFTLLEIILSIAILTLIIGLAVPILFTSYKKNDLDIAFSGMTHSFRRAQFLSLSSKNDSDWGVKIQTGEIIIFEGDDYSSRDSDFDILLEITEAISVTGVDEVIFAKQTGLPTSTGTVTLTLNEEDRDAIINSEGVIDY